MKHFIFITLILICFSTYAQNRNYTYDNLGRLTQIQYANGTVVQYTYDANGNRMQHIVSSTATTIDLAFNTMAVNTTTIGAGGVVSINATNANTGNAVAPSQYVKVWRSTDTIINGGDVLLDSIVVSSVNAMSTYNISNWNITIPTATTAGSYYLILKTDANNAITETNETNNTKYVSITVTTCPTITSTETISNATCGIANGSINMAISGGTSPYQYSITNGSTYQNANSFSSLLANTYTCNVKDANGCTSTKVVTVNSTGGVSPLSAFTSTSNYLTVAVTNNSLNATAYNWDFGDGYTSTSVSPSHTYNTAGLYNICLTASNNCGSIQSCSTLTINNINTYNGFPKMYHNPALEVGITEICKSVNNNGWIIPMSMVYNTFGGAYTNYIGKVCKVDTNGIPLWNIDFPNTSTGEIIRFDSVYAILINNNIVFINDAGSVINTIQGNGLINDITKNGNILTWIEQYSSNNTFIQNTFKLKSINILNPNVIIKQENLNLDYVAIHSAKVEAFSNGFIYFYGTYQDPSFIGNPYNTFIYKYSLSSCCGPAWQWSHNSQRAIDLDEDNQGNLVLSFNSIFTYNSYKSTLIINTSGSVISSGEINGYIKSDTSGLKYFAENNTLISTNSTLGNANKLVYTSPYFLNKPICDYDKQNNFLLSSDPSPLFYAESMNIVDKLNNDFTLNSTCLSDTTVTYTVLPTSTFSYSNLNLTGFSGIDAITLINPSVNFGVIYDSVECTPPICNTFADFLNSKNTACLGDTVVFSNNSTNANSVVWYINGVNNGTGNQLQKIFNSSGTYLIKLVATNGVCIDSSSITYIVAPALSITSSNTSSLCGQSNGSISINVTGGTAPLSYSINNGANFFNTNVFTNLSGNTYPIKVQDANGCLASSSSLVNSVANSIISMSLALNIPNCSATCNGTAIVSTTGGNAPYTYTITPSATQSTTGSFSGLCANTVYTITTTDATSCTGTKTFSISGSTGPTITVTSNPTSATICAGSPVTLTATGASSYSWSGGITNGVAFSPSSTSTYTVSAQDAFNCTATATKLVTVNPAPVVSITTSPNDTICQGAALTLTASGANSYSWSNGVQQGLPFIPTASTTYTVTATNANGCTKTATQNINISSPCGSCLPSVLLQGNPFTTPLTESGGWIQNSSTVLVPSGANVKLDAHAASFIQLNPGFQTVTGAIFLAKPFNGCSTGSPSIAITDTNASANPDTDLNPLLNDASFIVYPNPTTGKVKVSFTGSIDLIKLYDQFGKLLQVHVPLSSSETEIDLSPYSSGLYFIRAEGFLPVKIIKK